MHVAGRPSMAMTASFTVLEIATYRYEGHSVADSTHNKKSLQEGYRTKDEIEHYRKNFDPISHFSTRLIDCLVTFRIDSRWPTVSPGWRPMK